MAELVDLVTKIGKELVDEVGSVIRRVTSPWVRSVFDLFAAKNDDDGRSRQFVEVPFDFGFLYDRPILSESAATSLGITTNGLSQTMVETPFASVLMWESEILLKIGSQVTSPIEVYIVPDEYNEDNVNLLPAEVLWDYGNGVFNVEDFEDYHYIHLGSTPACCLPNGDCVEVTPSECDGLDGVMSGQPHCLGDNNGNGIDDACEGGIPTVSEWGLIVMTLLLLTAGAIVFGQRRRPATV